MRIKQYLGQLIIPKLPFTRHVFNHIRWEINAMWIQINNFINPYYLWKNLRIRRFRNLSVNIGCGPFGKKGWVNLDLMKMPNLYLRYDCRKRLPFRVNSVTRIRCEHFLEHLDPKEQVPMFLKSCLESLQEGGILRIIVPDAERYLLAYKSQKKADWIALGWDLENLPEGFKTQIDIINHVFRQCEEHLYAYDFETLSGLLQQVGFNKVVKSNFGVSVDQMLCDDLPNHKPYSLYVEALKEMI
ncbi:MAG: hypothetical protein HYS08_03065 [Chlamydiae bacterium]|nr:hypothetical protein [Chlamydiota bacterium]